MPAKLAVPFQEISEKNIELENLLVHKTQENEKYQELKSELQTMLPCVLDFFSDSFIVERMEKVDAAPAMKKLVHLMNSLIPSHLPNSSISISSSEKESGLSRSDESQANYKAETASGNVELSVSDSKEMEDYKKYFNAFVNSLQLISSIEEKERKIRREKHKLTKEPTQGNNNRILIMDMLKNWVKKGCKGQLSIKGKRKYEYDDMPGSSGLSKRNRSEF